MRLAIADPPYLGRAAKWYGGNGFTFAYKPRRGPARVPAQSDAHPDAHLWDDIATHRAMVDQLVAEFDGWAIAMVPDNLYEYLPIVPRSTRVAVWYNPGTPPSRSSLLRRWEPVLVYRPEGRRITDGIPVSDVFTGHTGAQTFVGAKPPGWTRWVLNMLGHQDGDEVVDLFHGSGAVQAEVNQGVLW